MDKITHICCVCIHNSARSQMAEAFFNILSNNIVAMSAGINPGSLNPLVVESMQDLNIDISKNKTKSINEVLKQDIVFDYIVFVCSESQAENCPIIPYECTKIYWSIDDPSTIKGSKESKLNIISTIRDEIRLKVKDFIISNKL